MASFIKGGGGSGGSGTTSNLGVNPTANTVEITNSGGDNATVPAATTSAAGTLTAADKTRLDGLGNADLSSSTGASSFTIHSSTGTDAVVPAATSSLAGAFTATDKTKLDALASSNDLGVTTTTTTVDVTSTGGTDATIPQATASTAGVISSAEKAKLNEVTVEGGVALGNNRFFRTFDNSANVDYSSTSHVMIGLDADQTIPVGSSDPRHTIVWRIPHSASKRQGHWEAYRMLDASTAVLAANGLQATQQSGGGSLSIGENGVRSFFQFVSGTAGDGDGYLLEAPNMRASIGSFEVFGIQLETLQSTNILVEAGVWDGTHDNKIAFYWDIGASGANFTLRTVSGGTATSVATSQGSGSTARWHVRIHAIDSSNIELITSNSSVLAGEYVAQATSSTNIPTADLYPYIRFTNRISAVSRTLRVDQFYKLSAR